MESVSAFEAQNHFPDLLQRAGNGETMVITQHSKPVAHLGPASKTRLKLRVEESVAGLLEFRKNHSLKESTVFDLINEGRKY